MTTPTPQHRQEPGARRSASRPQQSASERGERHDALAVFAGSWEAEGEVHWPDEARMIADETWAWLPGGFFLIGRFRSRAGEAEHKGFGYLAYDEARDAHTCRLIDNLGYDRLYELTSHGRTWTFRGERERGTYVFSGDGRSIDIRWEHRPEGRDWEPLCELRAKRTAGLGPTRH